MRREHVCKLKKALYGIKQVARGCYGQIDIYLQQMGFKSDPDPNLCYLMVKDEPHILVLHVDDLIRIGVERLIACCISDIALEFEMRDIRSMHHFCSKQVRSSLGRGCTN